MRPILRLIPLRKGLATVVALLAIAFFIYYARMYFQEIPIVHWDIGSVTIALFSVVLVVIGTGIVGTIWYVLLRDNDISLSWEQTQIIFAISQFGKYLPGNVGQHVGRVVMAREAGVPVSITFSTMFIEILWGTGIAAGLALLSLILFVDSQTLSFGMDLQLGALQLGAGIVCLLFVPYLGIGLLNRCLPGLVRRLSGGYAISSPRLCSALAVAVLFLMCFVVMGLILKLQAQWLFGITDGSVFELTCLFAVAWLAGYLTPGAPGGLGVREVMMVLLLSPVLGNGPAVGLGVTLRLTTTVGDLVFFLLGIMGRKLHATKT